MPMTNTSSQVSLRSRELIEDGRKPLVLVVDPDASARSVLQVVLVRDGFDVWTTSSGEEGLSLIKRRTPDVIVLESDLGDEDGFSFVSQVRGDAATSATPVLLLARRDDENVANLAEVVGVDDFVQKPAFARDVSALVRLELVRSRSGHQSTFQTGQLAPAHLLRALLSCPRSGSLTLADGRARVEFADGNIVDARFGNVWGIDALVRSLVLTLGEWSLILEPVEQGKAFRCSAREFVQVVLPRVHAWETTRLRSVALDSRLVVDFYRLSKAIASMPVEVNRIVQLFDGQRTVRHVLLDSPFSESMTLEVATRLNLMGIVLPIKDDATQPIVKKAAPRFFEPASPLTKLSQTQNTEADDWSSLNNALNLKVPKENEPEAFDELDGGWKAASLGDSPQLANLAPEVAAHLEAFNIRIEVDRPQASTGREAMQAFLDSPAPKHLAPSGEGPLPKPMPRAFDPRERIVTPLTTPVVTLAPAPAVLSEVERNESLEASFFASGEHGQGGASMVAALFAQSSMAVDEDAPLTSLPENKKLPIGLFLAVGAVMLLLAIGFEFATKREARAEPMLAAVGGDIVAVDEAEAEAAAPVFPDIEEPVLIEDDAPATVIDVSGPLREATAKYEQGSFSEAVSMLEQVVSDEPGSVQGWLLLGLARYDANNAKGAREAADRVIALEPNNARVQMLVATLSKDVGNKQAFINALQKYLELDPNGASASEARALLAR